MRFMGKQDLFTEAEGDDLLKLAEYALQVSQRRLCLFPRIQSSSRLKEHRGLFVSLWKENILRGCIGCIHPGKPLEEMVVDATLKAALKDVRFDPVCDWEIPLLTIEISILTSPKLMDISQIEIGKHGLMIVSEDQVGLLLPYVAVQNGWSVDVFLENACLKGHLPRDAWKMGASIFGFEVQNFKSQRN